ncbi:hypothetical protein P3S68_001655 [Capsicum galapagoense]
MGRFGGEVCALFSQEDSGPYIVIMNCTTLKEFYGEVSFSTTYASKVYVNLDIDYIRSLKQRFFTMSSGVQVIESSNISNIPIEEEMFMNWMSIKNLLESDWSVDIQMVLHFMQCMLEEVTPANGVYPCLNCNKDCKFPLVKYKIHIEVNENTRKTTFVLFNDVDEKLLDISANKLFNKLSSLDNNNVPAHFQSLYGKDFIFKLKLNSYNLKEGLENFTVSKLWIPDEKLELEYKLNKEKENLIEDESEVKDRDSKDLSTQKVSFDVLLDNLEDREEEVHVIDGANSRKRRNLIIDEDGLIDEDTNKFKK